MRKIHIICGTRPEAIKLIPLYFELKKIKEFDVKFISTGQHKGMLKQILYFFEVKPDIDLKVMKPNQTLSELSGNVIKKMQEHFDLHPCDAAIVQGDTTTAFATSLSAFYHKKIVIHVEAGLRTNDKYFPFPEEMNRRLITQLTDFHFAPTQTAADNLKKEGCKKIYNVGNTVIDSLKMCADKIANNENVYKKKFPFIGKYNKLVLITCHRRESFGEGILQICEAFKFLAKNHPDYVFVYPVHYNPNVTKPVFNELAGIDNIKLIKPVPYDELIYLMKRSHIILTDSGGIQEEAPSFNVPVIVLRNETERMEGIEAGCSVLAGNQTKKIAEYFEKINKDRRLYKKMSAVKNPYGDGKSSKRIVNILLRELNKEKAYQ